MKPARLVTIRFSHYCDKARWALERKHVPFTEVSHVPLVSSLAALSAGDKRTVPVLVTAEGTFCESQDIVAYADRVGTGPTLFPAEHATDIAALCNLFDTRVGPASRRIAYLYLLDAPESVREMFRGASEGLERRASGLLTAIISPLIRRGLGITPEKAAKSEERMLEVFAQVEARLADGRKYLTGDTFTAADLTFAALASPALMPPMYLKKSGVDQAVPPALTEVVERFRETKAGAFAMRMYETEREVS